MTDDSMSTTAIVHVWLNQQTSPPEIKIDGKRHDVKAFSLRFSYAAEEKYQGELSLAMDQIIPLSDEVTVICEGLQWRGKVFQIYMLFDPDYEEVRICFMGPPIEVWHQVNNAIG